MDDRTAALELWLRRLELRARLSEEDRAAIRALPGRVVDYGRTSDIVSQGQVTTHCCLVADGMAARFGQTREGLRQLTAFYLPGDMGDLHSAVLPRVSAPLQSCIAATVVMVPHQAILQAAEGSTALARAFWRDCVVDAQGAAEWMLNAGRRMARERIAHLMCELATRYALTTGDRMRFPVDFNQTHLADALGLTAVHVNRSLRRLRSDGAFEIVERQGIVHDWALLAQAGEFDPGYLHLDRVAED